MVTRRELLMLAAATPLLAGDADPLRPVYHFMPQQNWMNDPNGLIYHNGNYHMFYQYNPNGAYWGDMHWGHAVSKDLVHWKHLPIALAPTPGGPDKDGVFSGCCRIHNGKPTMIYTSVNPETQSIATSDDDLLTWKKYAGNPVIAGPPEGLHVVGFRDPCLWREGDEWMMALGSGFKEANGAVLLYSSKDMLHWKYLHTLAESPNAEMGTMWECPNFFPLGGKHVLLVSADRPIRKVLYFVGTYKDRRFTWDKHGIFDNGGFYYAPQTFPDAEGRRTIFGWSWEGRSDAEQKASGWAGVQTLPRLLSLTSDGDLAMAPHPAVLGLRGRRAIGPPGPATEVHAVFARPQGEVAHIYGMPLSYDGKELAIQGHGVALTLGSNESLDLRIFLDHSMVEIYANGRTALTTRIYPDGFRFDFVGAKSMEAFELTKAFL